MTTLRALHRIGRDARRAVVLLTVVVVLVAGVLLLLATAVGAGGDAVAPVDTLAPAGPGWSPAPPVTAA